MRRSRRFICASGRQPALMRRMRPRHRFRRDRGMGSGGTKGDKMGRVAEMRVVVSEQTASNARPEELRLLEALLFAAGEPLDEKVLAERLPAGLDLRSLLQRLQQDYASRGVNLVRVAGKWTFRTANDLSWLLTKESVAAKRLSRAAI